MSSITFTPGAVITKEWLNDLNTVAFTYFGNGTSLNNPTKLTIASVVTSLLNTTGDTALDVSINGTQRWRFEPSVVNFDLLPFGDNTQSFGNPSARIKTIFTPIIDSGTAGSLSFKTNNGTTQVSIAHIGAAVNNLILSGNATGNNVVVKANGSDANVGIAYQTQAAGTHVFYTDLAGAAPIQFEILHTASATRRITITGSNGGNPTIGVTAGSLAITPAVVIAGGSLDIGTNPATVGAVRIPNQSRIQGRNTANNGNINIGFIDGSDRLVFGPGDATTISASGNVIGLGTTAPSTSGTGITFPNSQNASTDINTLDDYEENTWTPTLGGTATYTVQTGTFTKIGRLVYITARLTVNSIGTGSATTISGLPFTTASQVSYAVKVEGAATAIVSVDALSTAGTSTIILSSRTAAAASTGANNIFQNNTAVTITGSYEV